ncbi:MAG: hypothetical protein IPJ77_06200 [Planctomycetes bacterium]|nr:hypothetical protein [Planctomycetota bacterium]
MRPSDKRLLQRLVLSLTLGLACGWIVFSFLGRQAAPGGSDATASAPDPVEGAEMEGRPPIPVADIERIVAADSEPAADAPSAERPAAAPTQATLRARLVDASARPLPRVPWLLVPRDAAGAPGPIERWKGGLGSDEGVVEIAGLAPGKWLACFTPTGREGLRYDLELPPGVTDLHDVVFADAGELHELIARLDGPGFDNETRGTLHLWSTDHGAIDRWTTIGAGSWMKPSLERDGTRRFADLPRGRYALAFLREDRAAEPEFRELDVPCDPVVFELGADALPVRVVVREASGLAVANATLLVLADRHAAPFLTSVPNGDAVIGSDPGPRWRWALLADGCAPRLGTRADLREVEGELVLLAELSPGRGALVVARDAEPLLDRARGSELDSALEHLPALSGVELSVGGRVVARTDADGVASCELPSEDAVLELSAPGRVLVQIRNLASGRVVNTSQPVLARFAPVN